MERREEKREACFPSSGRFTRHDFCGFGWRFDVYIHFISTAAATAEKFAPAHENRRGHNYYKDHEYSYDRSVAATTIIISHKIDPPVCAHDSHLVGAVSV